MKIAYLVHFNLGVDSGVYKKILQQVDAWTKLGHEPRIFCYTSKPDVEYNLIKDAKAIVRRYEKTSFQDKVLVLRDLVDELSTYSPDIIYTRQDQYYPPLAQLVRRLPVVVEINSRMSLELRSRSKLKWLYYLLTRRLLDRHVAGFVYVTHELGNLPYYRRRKAPGIAIANGIKLDSDRPAVCPANQNPTLVFIGFNETWHGIDKILSLAAARPDWRFNLIGLAPADLPGDLPKNIKAHGPLPVSEYGAMLAGSDAAIGPLALHRKGMEEACPLKNREYLKYGLPLIIAHEDTDFPEGAPFILQLPNNEGNIRSSMAEIETFVRGWQGKRVPMEQIRHLDIMQKEKKRIAFFQTLIEGVPSR